MLIKKNYNQHIRRYVAGNNKKVNINNYINNLNFHFQFNTIVETSLKSTYMVIYIKTILFSSKLIINYVLFNAIYY